MLDSGYKMGMPYISIMNKAKHSAYSMGWLYEVSREGRLMETGRNGLLGLLTAVSFQKSDINVLELDSSDDCRVLQMYGMSPNCFLSNA